MIRQMLKLLWNRKRSNTFLVLEFLLAFFVLDATFAAGMFAWRKYRQPIGFSTEKVLNITAYEENGPMENRGLVLEQIARTLKSMEAVVEVGHKESPLYTGDGGFMMEMGDLINGKEFSFKVAQMSVECRKVLDIDLIRGRWFTPEDGDYGSVVIDRQLWNALFGNADPLGKRVPGGRVIGVISDFRMEGELAVPIPSAIFPASLSSPYISNMHTLLVKLKTESSAELEARILAAIQPIAPAWTINISRAGDLHAEKLAGQAAPYVLAGMASSLLVSMLILGLMGVLWQNITRRTKEIGLRRANGATRGQIFSQIIGEMLMLATAGIVPGILIIVQLLFLDSFGYISHTIHIIAMISSAFVLYGMVAACSLYPGYVATRISPATALHYE